MPLEGLVGALSRDTEAEAEALLTRAREQAQAIARDAAARLAKLRQARAEPARTALVSALGARRAAARHEARASVLAARERCIERVMMAARERLRDVSEAEREAVTVAALGAALEFAPAGPLTIHCPARDVDLVRRLSRERGDISVAADDRLTLGLRLASSRPSVVVDATVEGALDRSRAELAVEIVRALDETP